ncbi:MAG TPA: YggS family pyridoxal phosphate-dependent enzyme [Bdellovibrionales bacterium]|nr:YggS family pyridoxal phosphate-dependent enzyme [Bdellovibrionales bacterium]
MDGRSNGGAADAAPDLAAKLKRIRERIRAAAEKSGRTSEQITLVGVSKLKPAGAVRAALAAGLSDFGENYVQELVAKMDEVADPRARWHYIGSLQRNKCKFIVGRVQLIHSVDRVELAREIDKVASANGRPQDILLQIKIGGEESKSGVPLDDASAALASMMELKSVRVKGFMTFPPLYENLEDSRHDFRELVKFQKTAQKKYGGLETLSMGSSHDFEIAIEEGSTIVRVGTDIFGERPSQA